MKRTYKVSRFKIVLAVSAGCAIVAYSIVTWHPVILFGREVRSSANQYMQQTAVVPCTYEDVSFCPTESKFIKLVGAADASVILENQVETRITCKNGTPKAYCTGAGDGVEIRLLSVNNNGVSQLMTRNDYIVFFKSYFSQYGPFSYDAVEKEDNGTVVKFSDKTRTAQYNLRFTKSAEGWKFIEPNAVN